MSVSIPSPKSSQLGKTNLIPASELNGKTLGPPKFRRVTRAVAPKVSPMLFAAAITSSLLAPFNSQDTVIIAVSGSKDDEVIASVARRMADIRIFSPLVAMPSNHGLGYAPP